MKHNILITGGNSEIGCSLIEKIYKEIDANLYSTRYQGESIKEKVRKEFKIDLSNINSKFKDEISSLNISHLVLIHGTIMRDTLTDHEKLEEILQVNLLSSIEIIKTVLNGMIERNYGRIVVVNTASLEIGGGKFSFSYSLSKSGLKHTVKHLAKHYSNYNILTNSISPGFIDTKFHNKSKSKEEINERKKNIKNTTTVDEVSNSIKSLLLDNRSITGQDIIIDGGEFI